MTYQLDTLLRDVRVCLDRNESTEALISEGDQEALMLDDIIRSKVLEGIERVHIQAPYQLLELGHNFDNEASAVYWQDQESGYVLLPKDFMRLVVFEMSDWERPVYSVMSADDPEYKKQRGRIKALRGTAQRPVCALAMRPEGKALEFYSCKSVEATVSRAVYIPIPSIGEDDTVDISERCYDAVVQMIAGLTLMTCGEADKAAAMVQLAQSMIDR